MHLESVIDIGAPWERVFALAADIARWPDRLPHYRGVRILARRGRITVRWRAVQEVRPEERRILFTHIGGPTRGMAVEWVFQVRPGGVRVGIRHELRWPPLLGWLAWIVDRGFITPIADRTLRRMKELAEAGG